MKKTPGKQTPPIPRHEANGSEADSVIARSRRSGETANKGRSGETAHQGRSGETADYELPRRLMNPLEARIGYKFRNSLLLAEAMTHPSLSLERKDYSFDNQRLEFLGDSVIQLVITEHLYRLFPDASEGQMTKMRTRLVSRPALKEHARLLNLGRYIMMGRGEEASGGRERDSTLADSFEALVGALFLDGGFEVARRFLLVEAEQAFEHILETPGEINPKGQLQEHLQALGAEAPTYSLVDQKGPEHSRVFICSVCWKNQELARGSGQSKKEAEVAAAKKALEALASPSI